MDWFKSKQIRKAIENALNASQELKDLGIIPAGELLV
jgi:hypothetical protein